MNTRQKALRTGAIFIALLLVAYVPWFSMVIPNLVMG